MAGDAQQKPSKDRPDPRDVTVSFRVSEEDYELAKQRAQREKRSLSDILRAFFKLWGNEEYPSPPVVEEPKTRAKKRKKK